MSKPGFIDQMTNTLIRPTRDIYPSEDLGIASTTKDPNSSSSKINRTKPKNKSISTWRSTDKTVSSSRREESL